MRILIACEYSGIVRDAFSRKGHDAYSCDIIETESNLTKEEGKHIIGDVREVLGDGWDLMIGHPPCKYISYAGNRVWDEPGRVYKRLEALKFFADLWTAPIDKICLENPKSLASKVITNYSQEIQPYYFGEEHLKTTWLWLKNLPPLVYQLEDSLFSSRTANDKPKPLGVDKTGGMKNRYYSDITGKSGKDRAIFWPKIAEAMADQWG